MREAHTLLKLLRSGHEKEAPELLVYAPITGDRLEYVCKFIFSRIVKCGFSCTNDLDYFKTAEGFKINYSASPIEKCYQVIPEGLLDEKGLRAEKPGACFKNGKLYFFASGAEDTPLHFDVFSAVFYFISRYEEWQAFEPDQHGRFETKASLLYAHKYHLQPVVDQWVSELRSSLQDFYPGLKFMEAGFDVMSTIDLDNVYAYKAKGLFRSLGACARDLLKLDFANLAARIRVLSGKQKDPFDIYDEVSGFCLENKIPLIYFFLFRTGTMYDRTLDPGSPAFKNVIKIIRDKGAIFGLHPSYDSAYKPHLLEDEIKKLGEASAEKIILSRQHFLRFDIRSTPKRLMEQGIAADFSMGFASTPGFRAGTTYPFYYYDLDQEKESDLLFIPFCVMDGVYTVYEKTDAAAGLQSMMNLAHEIKKTGGYFISVFHERTFSDHLYPGFSPLYKNLHLKLKELIKN